MKVRFNNLDVAVCIHEIKHILVGLRLSKIYDINNKTYLLKFGGERKVQMIIESGNRIHLTNFEWHRNSTPNSFTMKFRKHLEGKKVASVNQIMADRIVDICFGFTTEYSYHLIIELYDKGNIILTDGMYKIVTSIRMRHIGGTDKKISANEIYEIISQETIENKMIIEKQTFIQGVLKLSQDLPIKKALTSLINCGITFVEHCLLDCSINPNTIVRDIDLEKVSSMLYDSYNSLGEKTIPLFNGKLNNGGFIISKDMKEHNNDDIEDSAFNYNEYQPIIFNQHIGYKCKKFLTFNEAIDEFYSKAESINYEIQIKQKKDIALNKLENIKRDHQMRLDNLRNEQAKYLASANIILSNQELVNSAIKLINSAIMSQMQWQIIEDFVDDLKKKGSAIASIIKKLNFEKNTATLSLIDSPNDPSSKIRTDIEINLSLNAIDNIDTYQKLRKAALLKEAKTEDASKKIIKSEKFKTLNVINDIDFKSQIKKQRKIYWFEQFLWFISTDGFLIIGGRNQQQNELLVKRYLRPIDKYVHADLHGASSVVVRNRYNSNSQTIPLRTLMEAGSMSVCYSSSWDASVSVRSWWVNAEQVSKTAPTGEYLCTGSFIIRGHKNFMTSSPLVLGFGLLFYKENNDNRFYMNDIIADKQNISEKSEQSLLDDGSWFPETNIHLGVNNMHLLENEITIVQSSEIDPKERDSRKSNKVEQKNKNVNAKANNIETSIDISKNITSNINNSNVHDKNSNESSSNKRGKKSKLKKIKTKYRDQDDEERLINMQLLQGPSTKPKPVRRHKDELEKIKQEKFLFKLAKQTNKSTINKENMNIELNVNEHELNNCEKENYVSSDKLSFHIENSKKTKEIHEIEEEEEEDESKDKDDINRIIDCLTGKPMNNDVLLFIIPMVGPYSAFSNFRYKVKVLPGSSKRGKCIKNALQLFLSVDSSAKTEQDFIRSLKDTDYSRNIPLKIKITAPLMLNVMETDKRNKKQSIRSKN